MNTTYRVAGSLLTLALLAAMTIGWGCDKHRRTYVETYGTVGLAVPPTPMPPASAAIPLPPPAPQYAQGYEPPAPPPAMAEQPAYAAPSGAAAAAQPQYQQIYAPPSAQPLPEPVAGQPADASGVEVLARGPMHEAFAEPVVANPAPGITIDTAPPAAVQEMPPADRPAGAIWIPGYWGWDDDRTDFIWVSGIWRIVPPGHRWVPGYWAPVANGFQWVPGFWMAETAQQVRYLPTPPRSLEAGPVGVAPSPDYIWSTGYWYQDSRQYTWRPGCWQMGRADWVWVPAHYIWTPRGCVFVGGYWDYGLGGRGLLFAPVRFGRPLYMQPGYLYSPSVVIQTDSLSFAFFSRPGYSHYYYGDYFAASYVTLGIMPWYECRTRRDWYDPIYFHAAWSHRGEDRWEDHERDRYDLLRRDVGARPPRTFALQAGFHVEAVQGAAGPTPRPFVSALQGAAGQTPRPFVTALQGAAGQTPRPVMMAAPLSDVLARKAPGMRFEKLDQGRRTELQQYATSLGTYRDQRVAVEAAPARATREAAATAATAADARAGRSPTARPSEVRNPDLSRPSVETRRSDPAPLTARAPESRTIPRTAAPTNELRRPQVVVPPATASPATGGSQPVQPMSRIPQEIKRSQPQTPTQPQTQPTPRIPQEIKRPQPQVAAPEARKAEAPARPQVVSRPPTQPTLPQRVDRPAAPQQTAPAPRPQALPQRVERPSAPQQMAPAPPRQVQPQRVERPAAPPQMAPAPPRQVQPQRVERPAAPPQMAPAPQARVAPPVERPSPPRAEAPRMAPAPAARAPDAAPRASPAPGDGKDRERR